MTDQDTVSPWHLFERFGVELEYMIVDQQSLDVTPVADRLFHEEAGQETSDVERGPISWSNELVMHVVELKTTDPAENLSVLAGQFQDNVRHVNQLLGQHLGARLLPTGMHPWMDPLRETRLWPHENTEIYRTYDRIFGCQGHGWSNLQSCHINLPFCGEEEFRRLHAAIRVLLPLLPALAASTPVIESRFDAVLDQRLLVYSTNQRKIPELTGEVIPEPIRSISEYRSNILQRAYTAISPWDPDGVMQNEWLNSRGAIARFTRGAIEIRVLDLQEAPQADLAIVQLVVAVLRMLLDLEEAEAGALLNFPQRELVSLLQQSIRQGQQTIVNDPLLVRLLGYSSQSPITMQELWQHLSEMPSVRNRLDATSVTALETVIGKGPLASRMAQRLGTPAADSLIPREALRELYAELADCLEQGRLFHP